ncbi:MAG: SWIM zinc finger family protein [Chitinophagales bacterium]|nr:SWIM zinc finger family protein [Bacteroidota bacterium]MCB9043446.1 SWIM zinc finger family protein [Chitinophagales bacterium]
MKFTEQQIESIAPNPAAFKSGKSLSKKQNWSSFAQSERSIWGEIKGSGSKPYQTQIDITNFSYKCSCPSRQFPCKHGLGLMLLHANLPSEFKSSEEPEWVKNWMDKRDAKANKPTKEEELSPEQLEKREKAKIKTQENRFEEVKAGVDELELWLKDLVRIGLLELPQKPTNEFAKLATRMVDAKAPGLAYWVGLFGKINYSNEGVWQEEALALVAKIFLMLKTFNNYEQLSPIWQITIKNLVGWSQSAKELLASSDAEVINDQWLVAGQETSIDGDISTHKNWLIGILTNKKAIVVNHTTYYTNIENPLIPGSIIQGDFIYFPASLPYRGVFKTQQNLLDTLSQLPAQLQNWAEAYALYGEMRKQNPWHADLLCCIKNVALIKQKNQWLVYDQNLNYCLVEQDFEILKLLKWLAITKNKKTNAVLVLRNEKLYPLGVFQNNKYLLL